MFLAITITIKIEKNIFKIYDIVHSRTNSNKNFYILKNLSVIKQLYLHECAYGNLSLTIRKYLR